MFGPRVDHGNLRAVQPVDQTVHQGSARSPCPDDDNARLVATCAARAGNPKLAAAAPATPSARKLRRDVG
jgi:hypothetical protein